MIVLYFASVITLQTLGVWMNEISGHNRKPYMSSYCVESLGMQTTARSGVWLLASSQKEQLMLNPTVAGN